MTVTITVGVHADPHWNICDWHPPYGPITPRGPDDAHQTFCDGDVLHIYVGDNHGGVVYYACARHQDQLVCAWHRDVPCRRLTQPLGRAS